MEVRSLEVRKTPIALGFAATALIVYSVITLNAAIFPSVADQLLASFFQLSDAVHVDNIFHPQVNTFVFGAALLTGGTYVFALIGLSLAQAFANVGHRRALHIVDGH